MEDIMLTVTCATYNHAQYIRQTLDSIIMQKTNFKFRLVIHDDASTDGTSDIVREYAEKYPDIIVAIIQPENVYSQKIPIGRFTSPHVVGKYRATCEGDDYWTDPLKLQKQFDFMERHPEYSMCTHAYIRLNMQSGISEERHPLNHSATVSTEQVIKEGGGFFTTNSMFYRRDCGAPGMPFRKSTGVGDYPLVLQLAVKGKIYYFDEVMSCYRAMGNNSWTMRNLFSSDEKRKEHIQETENMLEKFDEGTDFKYHESVQYVIDRVWFSFYFKKKPLRVLKKEYSAFFNTLNLKEKLYYIKRRYFS